MKGFRAVIIDGGSRPELIEKYFAVRRAVFVKEQNVDISIEIDELENASGTVHLAVLNEAGECAGAGRLVEYDGGPHCPVKTAKLGRVCVLKEFRGLGLGELIVGKLIETAVNAVMKRLYFIRRYMYAGFMKNSDSKGAAIFSMKPE
ncbi:MAG TPA: GNAT family N-acetyltransferase [Candidatus Wallbacteria bacterium]|nr:GNAT family N-acetyltransferase [Candidatus Wallbacteria bacterium]